MPRIKVAVRIKPENGERLSGFSYHVREGDKAKIELTASGQKNDFSFDNLFEEDASQEEIFDTSCVPIIQNVLDGQNGTLFAYGQTGAGKTHTVTGPETEEFAERGLCMRSADYIFRSIRSIKDSAFTVKFSVIEIYNDSVLDLLRESIKDSPKLVIVDTPDGVVVPALYLLPLENEEEAYTKLVEANLNRSVAAHQLNRRSSRSHVIYSFYLTRSRVGTDVDSDVVQSKLHLVDLAGSERIEKTGSSGGVAKEATHINKSLSFLEQVVLALTKQTHGLGGGTMKKESVVAYRQSKLTYILKDSIGGNCNTTLVACIWPHANHLWETLSTLRFATRMRCIENHPHRNSLVTGNGANSSTRSLVVKIDALKKELALRDMMYGYGQVGNAAGATSLLGGQGTQQISAGTMRPGGDIGGLTKNQHSRTMKMTCDFVVRDDETDTVEVKSLAEVAAVTKALRAAVWIACGDDEQRVAEVMRITCGSGGAPAAVAPISGSSLPSVEELTETEEVRESRAPLPPTSPPPQSAAPRGAKSNTTANKSEGEPAESAESSRVEPPHGETVATGQAEAGERQGQASEGGLENKDEGGEAEDNGAFDHFKKNDGYEFHQSYEDVKMRLKEAKALQRTLVKVVNDYKAKIDVKTNVVKQINETIDGGGDEDIEAAGGSERLAEDLKDAQEALAKSKSEYKNSRTELLKCKEHIAELTIQKQHTLSTLVKAFEEYSTF